MRKVALGMLIIVFTGVMVFSQSKTVTFPKGKNTVIVKGNTARDNSYLFRLRSGKRVVITIISKKNNAFFHFDQKRIFDQGLDFMCEDCKTMNEKVGPGLWMISVFHTTYPEDKGPTDFALKIIVKEKS